MAASYNDREDEVLPSMTSSLACASISYQQPSESSLTSIRSKWSDIADRLEAPSSRNH